MTASLDLIKSCPYTLPPVALSVNAPGLPLAPEPAISMLVYTVTLVLKVAPVSTFTTPVPTPDELKV